MAREEAESSVDRMRHELAQKESERKQAEVAAAGAAVVLLGDFNCTPRSELYGFLVDGALAAQLGGGERWIEEEHALRGRLRSAYVAARRRPRTKATS